MNYIWKVFSLLVAVSILNFLVVKPILTEDYMRLNKHRMPHTVTSCSSSQYLISYVKGSLVVKCFLKLASHAVNWLSFQIQFLFYILKLQFYPLNYRLLKFWYTHNEQEYKINFRLRKMQWINSYFNSAEWLKSKVFQRFLKNKIRFIFSVIKVESQL